MSAPGSMGSLSIDSREGNEHIRTFNLIDLYIHSCIEVAIASSRNKPGTLQSKPLVSLKVDSSSHSFAGYSKRLIDLLTVPKFLR